MIDAFRISDLRSALDKIETDGVESVSIIPVGRNIGLCDMSKSPIPFVAVASLDMPVNPDNEP